MHFPPDHAPLTTDQVRRTELMGKHRLLTRRRVGILMGGRSAERTISLQTGRAVYKALRGRGYDVVPIDVSPSLPHRLTKYKIRVAFIALHGPGGEDGTMQGLLEVMRIPYTGSSVRASAVAMHKHAAKALFAYHGVPVPRGILLRAQPDTSPHLSPLPKEVPLPLVVKPATQGSTFGISIVRRASEWQHALRVAHRYDSEVLAESYIPGHEVTVSVLGRRTGPVALPAIEVKVPGGFYDYAAKYQKGRTQYLCPAPLSATVLKRVEALALQTYTILNCAGAARVDFRVTPQGRPYVLEVNTVPGMTATSLLPRAAAQVEMDYATLTEHILESALY